MTDLEAGGAVKPKRASKPRQKKTVSTLVVTPTTGELTGTDTAQISPPANAKPAPPQGASPKPPTSKSRSPRTAARPAKFRSAGPNLSDWLSFALLVLLIAGAICLYQWRGEAAKLPAASQTTGQPRQ